MRQMSRGPSLLHSKPLSKRSPGSFSWSLPFNFGICPNHLPARALRAPSACHGGTGPEKAKKGAKTKCKSKARPAPMKRPCLGFAGTNTARPVSSKSALSKRKCPPKTAWPGAKQSLICAGAAASSAARGSLRTSSESSRNTKKPLMSIATRVHCCKSTVPTCSETACPRQPSSAIQGSNQGQATAAPNKRTRPATLSTVMKEPGLPKAPTAKMRASTARATSTTASAPKNHVSTLDTCNECTRSSQRWPAQTSAYPAVATRLARAAPASKTSPDVLSGLLPADSIMLCCGICLIVAPSRARAPQPLRGPTRVEGN
mmetsp:Transcript_9206/g.23644  ORF Transcript_9206/g.23644 Transcript_9206/m.23644 type:complete len:316 (-) Transcript_9206:30-977(-)